MELFSLLRMSIFFGTCWQIISNSLILYSRRKGLFLEFGVNSKGFRRLWNKNESTKFIIHGWSGAGHSGPKSLLMIKNGTHIFWMAN